ncbi:DNA-binding transcriptional LysR family regulator [Bradyrhizobium sp. USDA 4503]
MLFMAMELYQIRQFVAVAETGSFTKAAVRATVSQPAISASIGKLEEELGQQLLHRRQGQVTLTSAGEKLLRFGREVLSACAHIKSELKNLGGTETIRVGALRTLPTVHVAAVMAAFGRSSGDVGVELIEGTREELQQRLSQKKLHLTLTSLAAGEPTETLPLFVEPYVCMAPADHPFAKDRSIRLADLHGERFILRTGCETFRATTDLLVARAIKTKVVYRTDQDDRALALVAAGLGVALMPALFHMPGVVGVPIRDFEAKRTIGLQWMPGIDAIDHISRMITTIRSHAWSCDLHTGEKRRLAIKVAK